MNNKTKAIIAYVVAIVILVGVIIFYAIYPLNKNKTSQSSENGEYPVVENWDDSEDKEGNINNIIEYNHTDTEETSSDEPATTPNKADNDESGQNTEAETDITVETAEISESDPEESTDETSNDIPLSLNNINCYLDLSSTLDIDKSVEGKFEYQISDKNVTLELREIGIDTCKEEIMDRVSELGAEYIEEILSFSSTRVYDTPLISYNKYTLWYNDENDNTVYEYYLVSQATDSIIYEVSIDSESEINFESELFSILDYKIETIE